MSTSTLGGSQSTVFQDFHARFAAFAQQNTLNTASSQNTLTNGQALPGGGQAPANFDLSKLVSELQGVLNGTGAASGAPGAAGTSAPGASTDASASSSFSDLLKQLETAANALLLQAQEQSGLASAGTSGQGVGHHHHHHHHAADGDGDDAAKAPPPSSSAGTSGQGTASIDLIQASETVGANGQLSFSFQEVFASITRSFGASPAASSSGVPATPKAA